MFKQDQLLNTITTNDGIITTSDAMELGFGKYLLKELVSKEKLVKIATGLYAIPGEDIDEYVYFSHRVPNGIFSHETAAYIHGLTTKLPETYVMSVKAGDNVSRITDEKDNIIFKYNKKELHLMGKDQVTNPYGREVPVYDIERTILDIIKDKDRVDSQVFNEAMKSYFESEEKNLLNLSIYAREMKILDKLNVYTEVLL